MLELGPAIVVAGRIAAPAPAQRPSASAAATPEAMAARTARAVFEEVPKERPTIGPGRPRSADATVRFTEISRVVDSTRPGARGQEELLLTAPAVLLKAQRKFSALLTGSEPAKPPF